MYCWYRLDLSAAFDTVDHGIILHRLRTEVGVCQTVLDWFRTYLSQGTQVVCIRNVTSQSRTLECGVPQGYVLGPILFTIYSAPIARTVRSNGLAVHLYVDDTQLYLRCDVADFVGHGTS